MSWDWHTSKGDGGKTFDPAMGAFTGKYAELTLIIDRQRARIEKLEAQLAEANEAARLQRALDRIYCASCTYYFDSQTVIDHHDNYATFDDMTWAEAAEQAATWAETQKEVNNEI